MFYFYKSQVQAKSLCLSGCSLHSCCIRGERFSFTCLRVSAKTPMRWCWLFLIETHPHSFLSLVGWGRAGGVSFLLFKDVHLFAFHSIRADQVLALRKWKKQHACSKISPQGWHQEGKDRLINRCDTDCLKDMLHSDACICGLGRVQQTNWKQKESGQTLPSLPFPNSCLGLTELTCKFPS